MVSLPCADEVIDFTKYFTELNIVQHHHHDPNQTDDCSPFCVCSCCSVTVDLSVFIFDTKPEQKIETKIVPYYKESISTYTNLIWQPPKIS